MQFYIQQFYLIAEFQLFQCNSRVWIELISTQFLFGKMQMIFNDYLN